MITIAALEAANEQRVLSSYSTVGILEILAAVSEPPHGLCYDLGTC